MIPDLLEISTIHAAYRAGTLTPVDLAEALLARIDAYDDPAVFITRVPAETVLVEAAALDIANLGKMPLFGIPFVVKDNIDAAGLPTTAGCPGFSYTPERDAAAVARLRAAGAILLGKANLDQFAAGLNGTRSPYGAPRSVFNRDYVSGGSSSGSAVAVGGGLAVFSLGTDTAGSGRVPAAFNNLVGLKPSVGRIAASGVVPACQTIDCISIFANSAADAMRVLAAAQGPDVGDPYSRAIADVALPEVPRVGFLRMEDRDFAGDEASAALYETALARAAALGWELEAFDYRKLRALAATLYGSAYVAERLSAIAPFYARSPEALHPVLQTIMGGAARYSAADAFKALHEIQALKQQAAPIIAQFDCLLLPTAPTIFTVDQMLSAPIEANATLGIYTNFVNFMDLAAISFPAGFRRDGMPFGVSLIGPCGSEAALAAYGERLHEASGAGSGKSRAKPSARLPLQAQSGIKLVVAGAHLSGMVLNHELTALGGHLCQVTETAREYRLYALGTTPRKPGLVRVPENGAKIAVELWELSAENFGRFVATLPAPMGIGKVTLADGTTHPGFFCEAHILQGALDITEFGGWRAYQASLARSSAAD